MSWFKRLLGGSEPPLPDPFAALLNESREHLAGLTRINQETWRFGRHTSWTLDQRTGVLRFTFADGSTVDCSAQAIGSCDTQSGSWLWAWANESLAPEPHLLDYANRLRAYGRDHQQPMLATASWPGGPDDGWTMAALAVKLCHGSGAFCGISGPLQMFLAFEKVKLGGFPGIDETLSNPPR